MVSSAKELCGPAAGDLSPLAPGHAGDRRTHVESPEDLRSITAQCQAAMANYTIEGVGSPAPQVREAEVSVAMPDRRRMPMPTDPGAA